MDDEGKAEIEIAPTTFSPKWSDTTSPEVVDVPSDELAVMLGCDSPEMQLMMQGVLTDLRKSLETDTDHLAEALERMNTGDWLKISPRRDADGRIYWATLYSREWPTSCAWIDDKLIDACGGSVSGALAATIEKLIAIRRREMEAKTDD
jgi:hypothetical protein